MKTEYGYLGTAQELILYEILQELKKQNAKPVAKKKAPAKKEVNKDE